MEENKILCPRCKGCGSISPPRAKIFSKDPTKKWCNVCKNFLDKDKFYSGGGYCKECQGKRAKTNKKTLRKKYQCSCFVCNKNFLGSSKTSVTCGSGCRILYMNYRKREKKYILLPNELRDEVMNGDHFDGIYE